MSDESKNPETDDEWAKHDSLSPKCAAHFIALCGKMEQERNVWKHNAGVVAAELESEQLKSLDWFLAFHALRNAVAETLEENCHLADGDQCTLKKLKDAYAKAKDAGTGLDSENTASRK
jgi:hypothetical protein